MSPPFPRAVRCVSRLVPIALAIWANCSSSASAQVFTPADLLALTGRVDGLDAGLGSLRTSLGGVGTDVASLKVEVGELRGLLGDLPDVVGPDGPVDLPAILAKLDTRTLANTTKIAEVDLDVSALQNTVVTQTTRLDDHERRMTRNEDDIRQHEAAIGELQSQMATASRMCEASCATTSGGSTRRRRTSR